MYCTLTILYKPSLIVSSALLRVASVLRYSGGYSGTPTVILYAYNKTGHSIERVCKILYTCNITAIPTAILYTYNILQTPSSECALLHIAVGIAVHPPLYCTLTIERGTR